MAQELFDAAAASPATESDPGCRHCGGAGLGNVCFLADADFFAHCADESARRFDGMAQMLAELPTNAKRWARWAAIGKHHPQEMMQRLREAASARTAAMRAPGRAFDG